ncbi:MAG: NADH-quinone oxidoreductase subunit NuoN [Alphaproteobacteria bacterium]|nr:NADH-quinone oxidoreductase subunit NuoN [Alphaproteobacteria bacterium]
MMQHVFSQIVSVFPELVLIVGAIVTLLFSLFSNKNSFSFVTQCSIGLLLVASFVLFQMPDTLSQTFHGMIFNDHYTKFIKLLVIGAAAFVLVMSLGHDRRLPEYRAELPVLMVLSVAGMMIMVSANDMLMFYVGLELQSLCLYIMAAIRKDTINSTEAGLKYFVLGALASGLLLFGISMIYGFSGTTSFTELEALYSSPAALRPLGVMVGIILVLIAIFFKISAVPFHMWTPDVYQGSPTIVTLFFAAVPKVAMFGFLLRFILGPFGSMTDQWQQIIVFVSAASMLVGALAAIRQTNIKRLLAFSSVGHVGYALMGVASSSDKGAQAVLVYLTLYVVMTLGIFGCVLMMRKKEIHGTDDYGYSEDFTEWTGLGKSHPLRAALITIFLLSMAGIPPLAGFFAKFYIFRAAVDAGLYPLVLIGALSSVIGAFYYIRVIKVMYFDEGEGRMAKTAPYILNGVVMASALINLFYFVLPMPLVVVARHAIHTLFS